MYIIVSNFSCRMGVAFARIWLYTFVLKKHDHSRGKPFIGCICHLVLKGRVRLYIICIWFRKH